MDYNGTSMYPYGYDPYLQHFGVKGMKWGIHDITRPLQAAWKYAMGENTVGYMQAARNAKKQADSYKAKQEALVADTGRLAKNAAAVGNSKIYTQNYNRKMAKYQAQEKAQRGIESTYKNLARQSFQKGAIYRGYSAVKGMASTAANRVYGAATTVKNFITTNGNKALTNISNAAGRFRGLFLKVNSGSGSGKDNITGRLKKNKKKTSSVTNGSGRNSISGGNRKPLVTGARIGGVSR